MQSTGPSFQIWLISMPENSKIKYKEYGCNSGGGKSPFNETEHKVMLEFTGLYISNF